MHGVGDFLAPVGRQAVQEDAHCRIGQVHQGLIDGVILKRGQTRSS
jgi:hypothetical protein